MVVPIIHCKRELQNLCLKDGQAGKAIHAGEKHHVAWCFPTLNSCILVDCLNLPVAINDAVTVEESSVDDCNMISCRIHVGDTDMAQVVTEEDNNAIIDDKDPKGDLEIVHELTLHPANEIPVINVSDLMMVVKKC